MSRKQRRRCFGGLGGGPRTSSTATRLEVLEERCLLSVEPSSWEQGLAALDATLLADVPAETAVPITPPGTTPDVPVAEPAVIDVSGESATTAASLLAYGGPGDPNLPGFNNVGKGSTGNTSVTYLGNGWAITASHVTIDNQYGPIRFGNQTYQVDMSTIRALKNTNGTTADLKIFRLTTDPGLPSTLFNYLPTNDPNLNDQVFMIGNGYTPGVEKYWHFTTSTSPWTWTEQSAPSSPGPYDVAGWTNTTTRAIRWGDNRVAQTGLYVNLGSGVYLQAFSTAFDKSGYTSAAGLPHEAQATSGDSGGAVFVYQNGRWMLAGIMVAVSGPLNGQPSNTTLYGAATYIADLSVYRNEILSVINPAPVASISGPSLSLRGESTNFTISAQDTPEDVAAGFRLEIDWGDNTPLQIINSTTLPVTVPHAFAASGLLTVRVTAFDQGNQGSVLATTTIQVDATRLAPNAGDPQLVDLIWAGTPGTDQVEFVQTGNGNTIEVRELMLNGLTISNVNQFSGVTGRMIAYGQQGNDMLDARGMVTKPATLNGNAGNNTLYGGSGGDILIGGSNGGEGQQGNNVIIAGNGTNTIYGNDLTAKKKTSGGDNLIVGGTGQDTIHGNFGTNPTGNGGEGGRNLIVGGAGADLIYASQIVDGAEGGKGSILISGRTTLGPSALQSILAEWTATHTYAQKLANLQGTGNSDRLNGNNFLQAGVTVLNDTSIDELYSDTNGQLNWLLISLSQDLTHRQKAGETITGLG